MKKADISMKIADMIKPVDGHENSFPIVDVLTPSERSNNRFGCVAADRIALDENNELVFKSGKSCSWKVKNLTKEQHARILDALLKRVYVIIRESTFDVVHVSFPVYVTTDGGKAWRKLKEYREEIAREKGDDPELEICNDVNSTGIKRKCGSPYEVSYTMFQRTID